ncbi:MAG: DNA replication/repair protein RecF [Erysipelothrix sp.]|nr:DNA replication/repair protein RecF [Erysipelothrix sp.]
MINNISLSNFRSYSKLNLNLSNNINVLIGKNGQGKTNLLESIYFISNIRSHRTKNDLDLIKKGQEYSRIIVNKSNNNKDTNLTCIIHQDGKYFSIDNNPIKKTSEMLGIINTVLFYPTETTLFTDSPAIRRNFFDVEIGKVSSIYLSNFQSFNKILKDRNRILKADKVDTLLLEILTNQLIPVQIEINRRRKILIDFINQNIAKYLDLLLDEAFPITINYRSSITGLDTNDLIDLYKKSEKKDQLYRNTSEGIHRDDYEIYSNDIEIDKFLSQGQIRIVLLAIKLVIVDFIYEKTKETPILLLDDVMSELDINNQMNLLNAIPDYVQTIITTTEQSKIFTNDNINIIYIENSQIRNEEN